MVTAARRRQEVAVELRDSAENNKDYAFYAKYLEILMPVVLGILGEEKTIAFQKESPDQVCASSSIADSQSVH